MATKKVLVTKKVLNILVKGVTKRQNLKNKLNAGEKREAVTATIQSMVEDLTPDQKLKFIEVLSGT